MPLRDRVIATFNLLSPPFFNSGPRVAALNGASALRLPEVRLTMILSISSPWTVSRLRRKNLDSSEQNARVSERAL